MLWPDNVCLLFKISLWNFLDMTWALKAAMMTKRSLNSQHSTGMLAKLQQSISREIGKYISSNHGLRSNRCHAPVTSVKKHPTFNTCLFSSLSTQIIPESNCTFHKTLNSMFEETVVWTTVRNVHKNNRTHLTVIRSALCGGEMNLFFLDFA